MDCDDTELDPGDSTLCTATGTAELGQYVNAAIAVALDPFGTPVASDDPSHYFGAEGGISVFKYTNGLDANEPPGPNRLIGDEVVWTYDVVNTGNTALNGIVLEDDILGTITCPQDTLGVGRRCDARPPASPNGASTPTPPPSPASTRSRSPTPTTIRRTTSACCIDIDIEKSTNGEDADDPTGPQIPVGDPVTWTYVVTNPGDVPLADVVVTDDQGVTPCSRW